LEKLLTWKFVTWLLLGLSAGISGIFLLIFPNLHAKNLNEFLSDLPTIIDDQSTKYPQKVLVESDVHDMPMELSAPETILPDPVLVERYFDWLDAIERCKPLPSLKDNDKQALKLKVEWEVTCQGRSDVPDWVWQQAPYIHPWGGTWALRMSERMKILTIGRKFFHVLELYKFSQFLVRTDDVFSESLTPEALRAVKSTALIVFNNEQVYLYQSGSHLEKHYLEMPRAEFDKISAHWPFQFVATASSECLTIEETGCWIRQPSIPYWLWRDVFLASLTGLVSMLILQLYHERKRKRQAEAHRELAAVAISHEIRHPVTSLMLSLESLREHLESLPEEVQKECGRMGQEVRRLKRLTEASEVFLRLREGQKPAWRPSRIESILGFVTRICASYQVQCTTAMEDRAFITDAYWFGIAIENLIKNAKKHGQPPVTVELGEEQGHIVILVQDAGKGLKLSRPTLSGSSDSQSGLGYGLYLTSMIIKNLGGEFGWRNDPTTFKITIQELRQ
jgi:signal transduction histidine kinase